MQNETRLDVLLDRWEDLRDQGQPTPTPEELCASCPELLDEFRRRVRVLGHMDALMGGAAPPATSVPGTAAARYQSLRFHARGGLGEVFVAHDAELHRDVALKYLRPERLPDADSRRRFLREAEITARLEHPGIVPVHGLAANDDGRPGYAMRFVQGGTLHDAIQQFHAGSSSDRLALRQLLQRFVTVCNTVAYAHSRGIIHRDLKPANILLGAFGETLVVDWGLAKAVMSDQSEPRTSVSGREQPLTDVRGSDWPLATAQGQVLGTPSYMSPEQAAGRWDQVGPASDIYSLGATLFTLLTGRSPFEGAAWEAIQDRIQRGDFPRPRQLKGTIPPALEGTCLKAMAPKPEDRYATAQELAAELEHWLADEPVTAYCEPWWARLGRWARHHRALTAGAVAALLAAVGFLAVLAVVLEQARARSVIEQTRTDAQWKRAETNFQDARQAVDDLLTHVGKDLLLKEPGMQPLRDKLLRHALAYYHRFLEQKGDEVSLRAEVAHAHFRIGEVTNLIGSHAEALEAFQNARDHYTQLIEDQPDSLAYRHGLAKTYGNMAMLQMRLGQHDQTRQSLQEGLRLLGELVHQEPGSYAFRDSLVKTHINLSIYHGRPGQLDEAAGHLQRALDLQAEMVRDHPEVAEFQEVLAGIHHNLGVLQRRLGQLKPAQQSYEQARDLREALVRTGQATLEMRERLATSYNSLGLLHGSTGQVEASLAAFERAQQVLEALLRENPAVTSLRDHLADIFLNRGATQATAGRNQEARASFQQARPIYEKLVDSHPAVVGFRSSLAKTYNNLAMVDTQEDPSEALRFYEKAIGLQEELVRMNRKVLELKRELADSYYNLAGKHNDAGKPELAVRRLDKQREIWQFLVVANPKIVQYQIGFGGTSNRLGFALQKLDRPAEALEQFEQAAARLRPVVEKEPRLTQARRALGHAVGNMAKALQKLGRPAEAAAASLELRELWPDQPAELYAAAIGLARCIGLVGLGKTDLSSAEQSERRRYADLALEVLGQARAKGFTDLEQLKKEEAFAPLRPREEFQKLLRELERMP